MKKSIILSVLSLFVSATVWAKTIHIPFSGGQVEKTLHLAKNDVVKLDTRVEVGQAFFVRVAPLIENEEVMRNFRFASSVVGVEPERQGPFLDTIYAGKNPGWVTYTFLGDKSMKVTFTIYE